MKLKEKGGEPKIVTRDGRNVRIICTDLKGGFPIVGAIKMGKYEDVYTYKDDGTSDIIDTSEDLFFDDIEKPSHEFKPFDKVLVRNGEDKPWHMGLFEMIHSPIEGALFDGYLYITMGNHAWKYCITYEGNEHLLGTAEKPNHETI